MTIVYPANVNFIQFYLGIYVKFTKRKMPDSRFIWHSSGINVMISVTYLHMKYSRHIGRDTDAPFDCPARGGLVLLWKRKSKKTK